MPAPLHAGKCPVYYHCRLVFAKHEHFKHVSFTGNITINPR